MTTLSVNINKIATLRNARGGNNPNVLQAALDIEKFGADGITVHPRPDERHIKYSDVYELKNHISTELNIEGNPQEEKFVKLVTEVKPHQVTLVPDSTQQLTSNSGWNTKQHLNYLQHIVGYFKNLGIRVSIFVDPIEEMIVYAAKTQTDRIELYTEMYATTYAKKLHAEAIQPYKSAAQLARSLQLGINAGHDLDLYNLRYLITEISFINEVSIGHALICDALYYGLENTVQLYKKQLTING